jgi:N-acetylneuraminic acid mutarotase
MIYVLSIIRFKRGKGLMQLKEGGVSIWLICLLAPFALLGMTSISLAQGNTWTTKANMPTPRANPGTCVVNGKIYAIGGETAGGGCTSPVSSQKVEVYDPTTNSWTTKAPMPTGRESLSLSAVNGKIYAIGGDVVQCLVDVPFVEEYDPQTDTWDTNKRPMPTPRTGLSSSVVNGKIYAIGGWTFSTDRALDYVEEYDPITDTWIPKAPMHDTRAWFSTCVVDGKIYAFGGRSTTFKRKTVEVYDPATDIWTRKNDMPTVLGNYFLSTVNGLIYIFGGTHTNGGAPHSDSWEYDPVSDTWSSMSPMPTTRSAGHASEVNGKIYVIGGSSTSWAWTPTSTVFEYTPLVTSVEDPSWGENNPNKFALHQNYPNPFNPTTAIEFSLPHTDFVTLKIYNILGKEVAMLVSEKLNAGNYSYSWDGGWLASGVYLYKIEVGQGFVRTRKMVLLR